jgi:DNA-directed RNA polymerase III subunit RPC1
MVNPTKEDEKFINLEMEARNYESNQEMCPNDGYVVIKNSEFLCGNVDKSVVGEGSKKKKHKKKR